MWNTKHTAEVTSYRTSLTWLTWSAAGWIRSAKQSRVRRKEILLQSWTTLESPRSPASGPPWTVKRTWFQVRSCNRIKVQKRVRLEKIGWPFQSDFILCAGPDSPSVSVAFLPTIVMSTLTCARRRWLDRLGHFLPVWLGEIEIVATPKTATESILNPGGTLFGIHTPSPNQVSKITVESLNWSSPVFKISEITCLAFALASLVNTFRNWHKDCNFVFILF